MIHNTRSVLPDHTNSTRIETNKTILYDRRRCCRFDAHITNAPHQLNAASPTLPDAYRLNCGSSSVCGAFHRRVMEWFLCECDKPKSPSTHSLTRNEMNVLGIELHFGWVRMHLTQRVDCGWSWLNIFYAHARWKWVAFSFWAVR